MSQRKKIKIWLTGIVLATVVLGVSSIQGPSLADLGVQNERFNSFLTAEARQATSGLDDARPRTELYIFEGSLSADSAYIMADVAVDEEFLIHADGEVESRVNRTLEGANALLARAGLSIRVASFQDWRSEDEGDYISARLTSALRQTSQIPGNLFMAVSHQATAIHDGLARDSGSSVIVALDELDEQRKSALIAHEIAHLLGAQHHEVSEECQGYGCIMGGSGFAYIKTWCEHHIQQIRDAVASKLAAQSSRG